MYAVETGIPIPSKRWERKYPWHILKPTESFFVPNGNLESLRASASQQKAKTRRQYMVRAVKGGVRVWRVA